MAKRVLWISETASTSDGTKLMVHKLLGAAGVPASALSYCCLQAKAEGEATARVYSDWLTRYVQQTRSDMIVLACPKTLVALFMPELTRLKAPLASARGSLFWFMDKPVIVVDRPNSMFTSATKRWIFAQDCAKIGRWYAGTHRAQPKFSYTVCRTLHDLIEARDWLGACLLVATDIETKGNHYITAVGYSGLRSDGAMRTFVVPFWAPNEPCQRFWPEAQEPLAWEVVRDVNANTAIKVLQNGAYDASHFMQHRLPLENWLLDTMHMWHSIYTEAPKRLDVISSILLDYYRYWKEENKGQKKTSTRAFGSQESMERYWRYNALDCYNTLLNARVLVALLAVVPWARDNYVTEFSLQVGPCLVMSMTGIKVNTARLHVKLDRLSKLAADNLATLRVMAADPDFNPNSSDQYAHMLFRILGAKMPTLRGKAAQVQAQKKSPYSVDAKVLKLVAIQHPILDMFIKRVLATKQPANMASKYQVDKLVHPATSRFMYFLGAAGTETGRLSGRKSNFWIGTNPQNVPVSVRDFAEADPGYVLFEPDFSQSDAMFVAFESGDETFIRNMTCGKDTHCLHAAHFFRPLTYEQIYEGYKAGDPFFADDQTGVRAVTKRIVHGKNYNMAGFTLYMTMGRAAAVAAAKAKGFSDAAQWPESRIVNFCQSLLNDYDLMYPGLARWKTKILLDGKKNGNRIQITYGRTRQFFGDLASDGAAQREAIAYYGQGGTAGNINRTMLALYNQPKYPMSLWHMLTQTHDSLLFQIRETHFHEIAQWILSVMEQPVTINGREMVVKADGKCGYAWGRGLIKYKPTVTLAEMRTVYEDIQRAHEQTSHPWDFTDIETLEDAEDDAEEGE